MHALAFSIRKMLCSCRVCLSTKWLGNDKARSPNVDHCEAFRERVSTQGGRPTFLGPGPVHNVAARGLDERPRDAVAREQEFRGEAVPKVDPWAGSASRGTSTADAQEQADWTDTVGTWRTLQNIRAVSSLVPCLHRWPRSRRPTCDENRIWERLAGGGSRLRVLVEPISGERWWRCGSGRRQRWPAWRRQEELVSLVWTKLTRRVEQRRWKKRRSSQPRADGWRVRATDREMVKPPWSVTSGCRSWRWQVRRTSSSKNRRRNANLLEPVWLKSREGCEGQDPNSPLWAAKKGKVPECPRITTRMRRLFNTRQQHSIAVALAWTDDHHSTEGRARSFDEWLHHSGRTSCRWRQAKTRVGSARESRWREGIFLGLFGAGQRANDCAIGTQRRCGGGTGNQARACWKFLGRGACLECDRLPWDRKRRDATTRANLPRTQLPAGVPLPTEPWAGGDGGQEPNALTSPRDGKPRVRPNRTRLWARAVAAAVAAAGSSEGHASRGTRRTAEDVGLPSSHDFAEKLNCEMSEVAEVFHPWRLKASRSLFDMLSEVVLDLRTWWNFNEPAWRAKCWATLEERKFNGCDRQLATVVAVSGEALEAWRHAAVGNRRTYDGQDK